MRKICQCVQNSNENVTADHTIQAIKQAGFDGVFIQWYDKPWSPSQQEQLDLCRKLGLEIVFAHLGYSGINNLWLEGVEGDLLIENYIRDLDKLKENDIDLVIFHLSSKKTPPMYNELGIKRLQKFVDYADKLGIRVAFENTRTWGYLEYVFDNIKNDNIGLCFDFGHYHCHFNDKLDWERFRNKIYAVHIHDNDKSDDLHLLPFDGTLDFDETIEKLNEYGYDGPVTLESCYRYDYLNESVEEFYKESFKRAALLETKFN